MREEAIADQRIELVRTAAKPVELRAGTAAASAYASGSKAFMPLTPAMSTCRDG